MTPLGLNSIPMEPKTVSRLAEAAGERAWLVGTLIVLILIAGILADFCLAITLWKRSTRWPARERILLRRPWLWREAGGVLIWLLAWYAAVLFLKPVWDAFAGSEMLWVTLHSAVFNLVGLYLVVRSFSRRGLTWRAAFGWARKAWPARLGAGAFYYLAAMPFIWFYALVYHAGLHASGYQPEWQDVAVAFANESSIWIRLLLFVLAVGLAPIFEEVLFRGMLLPLAARRWGTAGGVVVVSVLFSLVHFHLPSVVPLFVVAVAFSLGYVYSGSLLVPVTMHALFNGVNLVMLGLLR